MDFIVSRLKEKSSWGGLALVIAGVVALFWPSLVTVAAIAAIIYGLWLTFTRG
jgi:dolichol kinase